MLPIVVARKGELSLLPASMIVQLIMIKVLKCPKLAADVMSSFFLLLLDTLNMQGYEVKEICREREAAQQSTPRQDFSS